MFYKNGMEKGFGTEPVRIQSCAGLRLRRAGARRFYFCNWVKGMRTMKIVRKALCLMMVSILLAAGASAAEDLCGPTAQALLRMAPQPSFGSPGGEWTVFGLARWDGEVPDGYFDGYLSRLEETAVQSGGVLHSRKYTEYSRVVIALTALGQDPRTVGGYDLLAPLGDVERVIYQGINGAVYALLALDCGQYDMPGVREQYVDFILQSELSGGGFALAGDMADPDVTAMALQALSRYRGDAAVDAAVSRAVDRLSGMQKPTGGYEGWGVDSCESVAQVIVALNELEIDLEDPRFVKDGVGLLDNLLSYRLEDGSFAHMPGGESDLLATEQAFYALVSVQRAQNGQPGLYDLVQPALPDTGRMIRLAHTVLYLTLGW